MFKKLNPAFRVWSHEPAATAEQVADLERHFGHVPDECRDLVAEVTEIELEQESGQYLRIWSPEGCIEMDIGYGIRKYIPDAFPVGDDGGGRFIFYHEGRNGYGLYATGLGNIDGDGAIWITTGLSVLLKDDGIDKIEIINT